MNETVSSIMLFVYTFCVSMVITEDVLFSAISALNHRRVHRNL